MPDEPRDSAPEPDSNDKSGMVVLLIFLLGLPLLGIIYSIFTQ